MSLVDVNVGEAVELKAVPNGEYEISIISAEIVPVRAKPENSQIAMVYRINDEPHAQIMRDWLGLPNANSDDEQIQNRKLLRIKDFCHAFDYDTEGGIETDDLPGLVGKAVLKVEHSDEYGDQNRVVRYL